MLASLPISLVDCSVLTLNGKSLTSPHSQQKEIERIQSTLFISTSVISNNRLSRRENLVLVLAQKSKIRLQNIVEKRRNGEQFLPFSTIFSIYISN